MIMILDWFGDIEEKFGTREIFTGTMASSKTTIMLTLASIFTEFLEDLNCEMHIFTHAINKRENLSRLAIGQNFKRFKNTKELSDYVEEITKPGKRKVIVLDEVQFFDSEIIGAIKDFTIKGNYLMMSGLLYSFRGEYFPFSDYKATMEDLLDIVSEDKRHVLRLAKCKICRKTADYTHRLINGLPAPYYDALVRDDSKESKSQSDVKYDYQPRCKDHFYVPGKDAYDFVCFLLKQNSGMSLDDIKETCKSAGKINEHVAQQIVDTVLAEKQAVKMEDGKLYYAPRILLPSKN